MAVQPGTKLGPYEIQAQIGSGGMGEVYKAADTRLNRTVAIKVLPPHFAENPEMKQRFEREAQTIAGLNHPHICTLHDVGTQNGSLFLVMEYLEGETLAQRLARGPLPLDEALKVATEIADALDKAHSHGVTHRDLKPGNVMLTQSGAKLLDFGLAKLRMQAQTPASTSLTSMPTSADTTTPGTILGTMQYMAPEQLEGQEADARTDIFAFGVVLYEMILGKKAFAGRSQALLIAAIMSLDPEPLSKSQTIPPALDYVVKRCMMKDPEQRVQTAMDLVSQLRWIAQGGEASGKASPLVMRMRKRGLYARIGLAAAALLLVAMALPAARYYRNTQTEPATQFLVTVPDMPVAEAVSISPDGHTIAFSARDASSSYVFVRPINSETATKLAGTDGAGRLFWSPDSKSIAFFAGGRLRRVDASGGSPVNLCETPDLLGGTWNAENVILFASSKGLQRVTALGGAPATVISGSEKPMEPYFLPDGKHYLYLASSGQPAGQSSGAAIYAGLLDSKDSTRVLAAGSNPVYVEPGYLLYHHDGTLYAQQFSAGSFKLSGDAIRIADKIPYASNGAAAFSASQTGILVFRNSPLLVAPADPGGTGTPVPSVPLLWVDRMGGKISQAAAPGGFAGVDLSPDGKHIAAHRHDSGGGDVYIFEAGKDTPSKLTFDATEDSSMPVWSPDGTRIAYAAHKAGKWGIYVKLADNSRSEELVIESESIAIPMSWSIDGRLVYWSSSSKTGGDIYSISLTGDKMPVPILNTPADERNPQVSSDGKWIAYSSNETGRSEIYIKPFPEGPGKIQVSVNGGVYPRWRRDNKELYFMNLVSLGEMMASDIHVSGASIQRDVPHTLFQTQFVSSAHTGGPYNAYAVAPNGQQFIIPQYDSLPALYTSAVVGRGRGATLASVLPAIALDRHASTSPSSTSSAPITVVLNWSETLKGR
jgi:Tol biopolymer transport system component/predicted Ser/Thr protein kinase